MGKGEKRVDGIVAPPVEEITFKLDPLRVARRTFVQHRKASAELDRLACVLRASE